MATTSRQRGRRSDAYFSWSGWVGISPGSLTQATPASGEQVTRDLILFFSGIDQLNFSLPLNKQEIDDVLVKNYAKKLAIEWTNELLFVMSKADCGELLKVLSNMVASNVRSFSLPEFEKRVKGRISIDPALALNKLFEYSLIGEIDEQGRLYFTHRQDSENPLQFNPDAQFTFQRAFLAYGNSQSSGH